MFRVAMISEVFVGEDPARFERLCARLREAKSARADVAVLPELALNPWSPATKEARDADAEELEGPRQELLSRAAREAAIGLVGGVILRDSKDGKRMDTALVYAPDGRRVAHYAKVHLPREPGFWETSHYEPGSEPPRVIDAFDMPFGIQICSDIQRPEGCQLLRAQGAELVVVPRATELATYRRWRMVFRANAMMAGVYILSVNRPGPEQGVMLGGPSIGVAPDGEILAESNEPVVVLELSSDIVKETRARYPGYLPLAPEVYASGWRNLSSAP